MTAKQSAISDILQSEVKNLLPFEKSLFEFGQALNDEDEIVMQ